MGHPGSLFMGRLNKLKRAEKSRREGVLESGGIR